MERESGVSRSAPVPNRVSRWGSLLDTAKTAVWWPVTYIERVDPDCFKAGCPVAPRYRSGHALPVLQQVADLGQEFLVLRQRRGRGPPFLLWAPQPAEEFDDEEEQRQGHDHEVDDLAEEQAVGDLLAVDDPLPVEIALFAGQDDADKWHDDVLYQRIDDLAERGADDHADGQVDDVPLQGERLEFVDQRERPLRRVQRPDRLERVHSDPLPSPYRVRVEIRGIVTHPGRRLPQRRPRFVLDTGRLRGPYAGFLFHCYSRPPSRGPDPGSPRASGSVGPL